MKPCLDEFARIVIDSKEKEDICFNRLEVIVIWLYKYCCLVLGKRPCEK